MRGSAFIRYEQLEAFPKTIKQELRSAVVTATDKLKMNLQNRLGVNYLCYIIRPYGLRENTSGPYQPAPCKFATSMRKMHSVQVDILEFARKQLKETEPRDDYRELMEREIHGTRSHP